MKYHPPFGSSDADARYVDRNTPGAVSGSRVPAAAVEHTQREIVNVISRSGLAPDGANQTQLAVAIQRGSLNYAEAAGQPNALTAVLSPPLISHVPGMPVRLKIKSDNTGAASLNAGPGALPIRTLSGGAVSGGDLAAGTVVSLICTGEAWALAGQSLPVASVTRRGIVELATGAETLAGEDGERAVVPAQAAAAVQAGSWVFAQAAGSANALTAALQPAAAALRAGMVVNLRAAYDNSGPATLNIDGLGAKPIWCAGATLRGGELWPGGVYGLIYDGTRWHMIGAVQRQVNQATAYYVNPATGADTNDGTTAAKAFRTLQRAVDVVSLLSIEGAKVTIQCAPSNAYQGVSMRAFAGSGSVEIVGDRATPGNCRITAAGNCVSAAGVSGYSIAGFRLTSTGGGGVSALSVCVSAINGGAINVSDMEYGEAGDAHLFASGGGSIVISGAHAVIGSAPHHLLAQTGGILRASPVSRPTLNVGASAFTVFAQADSLGLVAALHYAQINATGAVTGRRAQALLNGVITTSGGAEFFPGNAPVVTATGGQYV